MSIDIVLDSGTPVPGKLKQDLAEYDIRVRSLPFTIAFGEKEFLDGVNITDEEFYPKMLEYEEATGNRPTTSQPNPEAFKQAYLESLESGAEHIIAMPILKKHSGTYDSAVSGAEGLDIHVIDTQSGSAGIMFQMIEAFDAYKQGKSIDEVVEVINNSREKVYINLFVDSLSYVKERLSDTAQKFIDRFSLIRNIKVEFIVKEGVITPVWGERTKSKIINRMFKTMEKQFGDNPIVAYTLFTDKPEVGDELAERMQSFNLVEHPYVPNGIETTALCAAIGRYIGPGGGGVVTYTP